MPLSLSAIDLNQLKHDCTVTENWLLFFIYILIFIFHASVLTFQSLAVSLRTTRFNIQKFYMALALC